MIPLLKVENRKLKIILLVLFSLVLIGATLYTTLEPLTVAGNSMSPTLKPGDRIIVETISKYVQMPERGEIIVFREPHERKEIFVKRVIGLPGETVKVEGKSVTIVRPGGAEEVFEGGIIGGTGSNEPHTRVLGPEDYFVMGDNRRGSTDSRAWGTVQPQDIIGRPLAVLSQTNPEDKRVPLLGYQKGHPFVQLSSLAFWLISLGRDGLQAEAAAAFTIDQSLRLNDDDSAYLNRSVTAGNLTTFTISAWVKHTTFGAQDFIIATQNSSGFGALMFDSSDRLAFYMQTALGANQGALVTTAVFRDPSAWYHVVAVWDSTNATAGDRMRLYVNGSEVTAFGTDTNPTQNTESVTLNTTRTHYVGADQGTGSFFDGYFAEVVFIDGQALAPSSFGETDTTTGSWKPKSASGLTYGTNGFHLDFAVNATTSLGSTALGSSQFSNGDTASFTWTGDDVVHNAADKNIRTSSTFVGANEDFDFLIDVGATDSGFAMGFADNGSTNGSIMPSSSATVVYAKAQGSGPGWDHHGGTTEKAKTANWTANHTIKISRRGATFTGYIDGVLDHTFTVTSSNAGMLVIGNDGSGTGSQSNNVRVVRYADFGTDVSGNSNHFYSTNLASTDQMSDTPTNNYATWSPLDNPGGITLSNGNLQTNAPAGANNLRATFTVSSGKWYWETKFTSTWSAGSSFTGILNQEQAMADGNGLSAYAKGYAVYPGTGNKYNNGTNSAYGSSFTLNDVIMIALDLDNGKIWWGKNGTWFASGDPAAGTNAAFTGLSGNFSPAVTTASDSSFLANFGQTTFTYTPPTGFSALNTSNLPTPTIADPTAHFQATLYTGTGATKTVTQTSHSTFQPSFVWIKNRTDAATSHAFFDAVRGVQKFLSSDSTAAEDTDDTQSLSSFDASGFSLGTGASTANVNTNAKTYVAWQWKANGSGSSNTSGSITSTVSANTTAGISVVTYTGTGANATVGHGLGIAPKLYVTKGRSGATDWNLWHTGLGTGDKTLYLNATNAVDTGATWWNSTVPSATVFSLGTSANTNGNGTTFVAYVFAEVEGFSKFGSYTGNGAADGPFVYTGFKPAYVMIKRTDAAGDWIIHDNARDPYNVTAHRFYANAANAENVSDYIRDHLSNGFKVRDSQVGVNASGGTYIYAAFAEMPFKYATAGATAASSSGGPAFLMGMPF